jgi:Uma2 family endonuclease
MEQVQAIDQTEGKTEVSQSQHTEKPIPMSYAEFLKSFDESTHAEWVNGEAIVFMPPNTRHQRIVSFLHLLIGLYLQVARLGEIFAAPYAMRIQPDGAMREPDLLFVATENSARIGEQRLNGPADLIVEVISSESIGRDRADKFYEYQAGGVREYWIIDPRPGFVRADFWVLDSHGQFQPVPINADGTYRSTVLTGFTVDVSILLSETLPEPIKVVSKMVGREALLRILESHD